MKSKNGVSTNSVLTELCELVLKPVEVPVLGKILILHPPDPDKAFALRDRLLELTQSDESQGSYLSFLCSEAITLCVPGCELDLAKRLYNSSGGEQGELAKKALALCGLDHLTKPLSDVQEDETPFLSQEKPAKV